MSNSSQVRSGINAFLQAKISQRIKSVLFPQMPTLEFLFALNGDKTGADGLGRPKQSILVGTEAAKAKVEKIMAEREYRPMVQSSAVGDGDAKAMSDYDNDPVVAAWDSSAKTLDMFVQPRVKFARIKMPYKVAHSAIRTAKSGSGSDGAISAKAIGSVYDAEVKTRTAKLCEILNKLLWGTFSSAGSTGISTTGLPTNEDLEQWNAIHSFAAAASASNTYCGVDRSVNANAYWRGNTVATSLNLTFENLINYCNYDLEMAKYGLGVQLIGVGATLMKKAKAEAKTESYQLMTGGIPEFPEFGFKRDVVRIYSGSRPVYVYYDPECPASTASCIDPSTWTVAFAPEGNFRVTTPSDQTKVEGGDEADTGTIQVELMIVNEVPKSAAYFTGLS